MRTRRVRVGIYLLAMMLFILGGCMNKELSDESQSIEVKEDVEKISRVGALSYDPVPEEDKVNGRNDNVYNPAKNHPIESERVDFANKIKSAAVEMHKKYGVPASVIIGMAMEESGCGYTRTAYYANNFFGIKKWGINPKGAYQLRGQPDENDGNVKILKNYGSNRLIFDESSRPDNWYWKFNSQEDCIKYLVDVVFSNNARPDGKKWPRNYKEVAKAYQKNIVNGMSKLDAARKFAYDLAYAGYCQAGNGPSEWGEGYKNRVGNYISKYNLTQYDDVEAVKAVYNGSNNNTDTNKITLNAQDSVETAKSFIVNGEFSANVVKVVITCDGYSVKEAAVSGGKYSFSVTLYDLGNARILKAAGINSSGKEIISATRTIKVYKTVENKITISAPDSVEVAKAFSVSGDFSGDIVKVKVTCDGYALKEATVSGGKYNFSVVVYDLGNARVLKAAGINSSGIEVISASKNIKAYKQEVPQTGVLTVKPADLKTDSYKDLWFLKDLALQNPMTEEEGRTLYFNGMLPQASNKTDFNTAVNKGVTGTTSAQCAYTTSSVLEEAAKRAGLTRIAKIFESHVSYGPTHNVEIAMRKLGWTYYYKKSYVAPKASIAMYFERRTFYGYKQHSGHIYTMLKDMGYGKPDIIADNGGYEHVYLNHAEDYTEGFWLPPGVYPIKR